MGTPSYSAALFDCAMECALRRQRGKCNEQFGGVGCNGCRVNVNEYIDADPKQTALFMLQAETRAANMVWQAGRGRRILIALAVVIAVFVYVLWHGEHEKQQRYLQKSSVVEPSKLPHDAPYQAPTGQGDVISALHGVTKMMKSNADVNGDGLTNCIDAAVTFYKLYPDKSKVIIIRNYNTVTGMNHLFNAVQIDGVWKAIEPQAFYAGKSSYFMKDVWSAQYDSSHNVDSTERYKIYAK